MVGGGKIATDFSKQEKVSASRWTCLISGGRGGKGLGVKIVEKKVDSEKKAGW